MQEGGKEPSQPAISNLSLEKKDNRIPPLEFRIESGTLSIVGVGEGYPYGISELIKQAKQLTPYIEHLQLVAKDRSYNLPESFINLPTDREILDKVTALKEKKVTGKEKLIILVGIGGSSVGTQAIYDALLGHTDILEPDRFPKLVVADTIDPNFSSKLIKRLQDIKDPSEVLINVVSKSGTTVETLKNLDVIIASLKDRFPNILDRFVATTAQDSPLWKLMEQKGVSLLSVPEIVTGRYSVLSAVGLFPLAACGIDINELLQGAEDMKEMCMNKDIRRNPAVLSAAIIFRNYRGGKKPIHGNFFFNPAHEQLGEWCEQLMAESLGKAKDASGKHAVSKGIMPITFTPKDFHSKLQLLLEGPKNVSFSFIREIDKADPVEANPSKESFTSIVEGLPGKSEQQIAKSLFDAVKFTFPLRPPWTAMSGGIPFVSIYLREGLARSLGEFMQFKMMETVYLARFMNVNAFDNPAVESYKKFLRRMFQGVSSDQIIIDQVSAPIGGPWWLRPRKIFGREI